VLRCTPGAPHLPPRPLPLPQEERKGSVGGGWRARTLAIPYEMVVYARYEPHDDYAWLHLRQMKPVSEAPPHPY
jgi:hypothetical protein